MRRGGIRADGCLEKTEDGGGDEDEGEGDQAAGAIGMYEAGRNPRRWMLGKSRGMTAGTRMRERVIKRLERSASMGRGGIRADGCLEKQWVNSRENE